MPVNKGDVIDENANNPESCRVLVEVLEGGAGFEKILCCGNELTDADKVTEPANVERFGSQEGSETVIIDESKNNPNSCGLKVKVTGGAGLEGIYCCGRLLTVKEDSA